MPLFQTRRYFREGQLGILRCVGAGYPPPTVQWNETLSGRVYSTNTSMLTNEENITRVTVDLIFTEARREDTGVYECLISSQEKTIAGNVSLIVRCMQQICTYVYHNDYSTVHNSNHHITVTNACIYTLMSHMEISRLLQPSEFAASCINLCKL